MKQKHILVIDNFDSFTFNLVDYIKQTGSIVTVYRNNTPIKTIEALKPDLLLFSPGPGNPSQSGNLLEYIIHFATKIPQFGVCLGLEAMIEAFGGSLKQLDYPMHGKASLIKHDGKSIFKNVPNPIEGGRYHSLVADDIPDVFEVSAETTEHDGSTTVMGIRHKELPLESVQFHPESVLTFKDGAGNTIINNVIELL